MIAFLSMAFVALIVALLINLMIKRRSSDTIECDLTAKEMAEKKRYNRHYRNRCQISAKKSRDDKAQIRSKWGK